MQDDARTAVFDRIDAALQRIERATAARTNAAPAIAEAYALLDERHALLRLRIQETIERLDRLVEVESSGPVDR